MHYILYFHNTFVNHLVGVCVLGFNFILKNLKTLRLKKIKQTFAFTNLVAVYHTAFSQY